MSKKKILLIDYEPRSIGKIETILGKAGYEVEVANDGVEGMKAFERLKPDLTLIEAMIPKKHGFEVCQELKKTEHGAATPILILTAVYKGRKYRSQAVHLYKCDEYLEKPIQDDMLRDTVNGFLKDRAPVAASAPEKPAPSEPDEKAPAAAAVAEPLAAAADGDDLTENEIMRHLDAIIPDDPGAATQGAASATAAPNEDVEPAVVLGAGRTGARADDEDPEIDEVLDAAFAEIAAVHDDGDAAPADDGPDADDESDEIDLALEAASAPPDEDEAADETAEEAEPTETAQAATEADESEADTIGAEPAAEPEPDDLDEIDVTDPSEALELPALQLDDTADETEAAERAEEEAAVALERAAPAAETQPSGGTSSKIWIVAAAVVVLAVAGFFAFRALTSKDAPASSGSETKPVARPATPQSAPQKTPSESEPIDLAAGTARPAKPAASDPKAVPPPKVESKQAAPKREPPATAKPEPKPAATKPESEPVAAKPKPPAANPEPKVVEAKPEPKPVVAEPEPKVVEAKPEPKPVVAEPEPESTTFKPEPAAPLAEQPKIETSAPAEPPKLESATTQAEPSATSDDLRPQRAAPPRNEPASRPPERRPEPVQPPEPRFKRGQLVELDQLDVTPKLIASSSPSYTERARRLRQQGSVALSVLVDENGDVADVKLIEGIPRSDLNDQAIEAVRQWKYLPGQVEKVPVKTWTTVRLSFKL